jgi:hypothetical protein
MINTVKKYDSNSIILKTKNGISSVNLFKFIQKRNFFKYPTSFDTVVKSKGIFSSVYDIDLFKQNLKKIKLFSY